MRRCLLSVSLLLVSPFAWPEPPEADEKSLYRDMAAMFIECSAVWDLLGSLYAEDKPNSASTFQQIGNGAEIAAWHFLVLASGDPDRPLGSFKDYTETQVEIQITGLSALAENDLDAFTAVMKAKMEGCQAGLELQEEIANELRERMYDLN